MSTSRTEIVPDTWDDGRDVPFFRITARLFPPQFCWGAGMLLAGNDDEQTVPAASSAAGAVAARAASAALA